MTQCQKQQRAKCNEIPACMPFPLWLKEMNSKE